MRFVRRVSGKTFQSLNVRNFRLYFIGQLISISGTWMQSFAQGFLVVWTLRASPVDLGITVALPFLPMLLLGPFGGVLVDRSDKRMVLYFTQSGAALLALSLGILVSTHHVSLPAIWTLAALLGVVNLFDNPARQSFVQEMVGKDLLPNAVSLNSALINMGRVVGPAIGGALLFVGIATCFYVNAASYVALLVALVLMRTRDITRIRTVTRARGQVRQGLHYAFANREIREVLTSVTIVGLFAFNFTVTLPLLAIRVLHGTSVDYSLITCSMGLGGLLGGLYVAHRSRPTRKLLGLLAMAFGLLMGIVAVAPSIWLACLAIVPMGAASLAFVSTANATLQLHSDEHMRGRVMSLYAMGFLGTTPIGALVVGSVAAASNARVAIAVGAFATVIASALLLGAARAGAPALLGAAEAAPA
jgi:MFS family permease